MSIDKKYYGFAEAHIKQEGAPAHPDDVFIHCGCEKCEEKYKKQLKAYNDFILNIGREKNYESNLE